jgi:hypothetical protein
MQSNLPTRRWFRFSLKTLLIAITVFGLWLGYYVNWMHERRAAKAAPEVFSINHEIVVELYMGAQRAVPPPHPFPWSLTLLGEKPALAVGLHGSADDSENQRLAERYQKLFPESRIGFMFKGSAKDPANQTLEERYQKLLPECEIAFTDDVEAEMAALRAQGFEVSIK